MKRRKIFKKKYCGFALLLILSFLTVWTIWENLTVGTTYYHIESERIPRAFDGYKIAVVSDLHNAEFGKENSQIIKIIEKAKPDMIAITGDLVDSKRLDIDVAITLVQKLMKIATCYYVTGNHEAWIGQRFSELERKLLDEKVEVLRDRVIQLEKDQQYIEFRKKNYDIISTLDELDAFGFFKKNGNITISINADELMLTDFTAEFDKKYKEEDKKVFQEFFGR